MTPRPDAHRVPAERPLSARSVMASLLLGRRSSRAPARDLVRWCGLFRIAPGTARVALHRMTVAGELAKVGGDYELVGGLARRQQEQQESLDARPARWNGTWRMAVVGGEALPARVRADVRRALSRARLSEWRDGVWLRPANLPDLVEDPRCDWLDVRPDADPVALAATLFAPAEWRRGADVRVRRLELATEAMRTDPEATIADAFLAGAAALRHIRADPLLPPPLLPTPWPGAALRDAYRSYQREFNGVARAWFRAG